MESIISNLFESQLSVVDESKELIKKAYKIDNRPWVVGYSGGKDSTVMVQLIFEAMMEMPKEELTKTVYVISSDTLVETPLIINSINQTLSRIQNEAIKRQLPIETHKVKPLMENSFWVNLIGRGYPSPNQTFRWCTDRLKIDPSNQFIKEKVSTFGEVVMALGVREDESVSRGNNIRSHSVEGKMFMRHSTLANAFVFAPIRQFTLDDVWNYLLNSPSPWGDDNYELHKLYQDSASGECPLVVDKSIKESAGSCGNSRFGCWVCTVVTEDKALTGFIQSGEDWMKPLLNFRNWLTSIRDERTKRMKYRMNGQTYIKEVKILTKKDKETKEEKQFVLIPKKSGRARQEIPVSEYTIVKKENLSQFIEENNINLAAPEDQMLLIEYTETGLDGEEMLKYGQLGLGPYTLETRNEILQRLLAVQATVKHPSDPYYELISNEELKAIREIWFNEGVWEDQVSKTYYKVYGKYPDFDLEEQAIFSTDQISDLEMLCQEYKVDIRTMKKLINMEQQYAGYKLRRGVSDNIAKILKQDYLHL